MGVLSTDKRTLIRKRFKGLRDNNLLKRIVIMSVKQLVHYTGLDLSAHSIQVRQPLPQYITIMYSLYPLTNNPLFLTDKYAVCVDWKKLIRRVLSAMILS